MTKIIRIPLLFLSIFACGTYKPSQDEAEKTSTNFTYIKDSKGICYAMVSSYTYSGYSVTSITMVPCDKVGL